MDLIVNLIIALVVIISIVKRVREVGGKGEKLSTPREREVPPEALSEQIDNAGEVMRSYPEVSELEEEVQPVFQEKITIEDVFRKFSERQVPLNTEPFHEPEKPVVREVPVFTGPLPQVDVARVRRKKSKPPEKKPVHTPLLHFGGTEVVRGVIMSEILGPPVSMRDDSKW